MDDVRQLTEIARDYGIATDYHINESPMMDQPDFQRMENNETFITREDWEKVDELVDWLIDKKKSGYKMVNSASRLDEMRHFMRGKVQEWNCRAGFNSLIVRTDGTLAPCFPMYNATYDWGTIENHKFESKQLTEMKKSCQPHCFSTLNHILAYCYNDARVIKWMFRQALNRFQGATNFD
jgi:MoaA/NifB/PqqE/SkfB family radical SAM enzyme